jgi:L-threonine-O-3-phosphate decarboxylase
VNRPQHGGNLAWAASIAGCPASAIVDFSASINPLGIPQSAIAAIAEGIERLTVYPDPQYSQLRSVLAEHHHINSDCILPGNGSAELLTWACRELAQQKVTNLITPAFGDYQRALNAFGAKIAFHPLNLEDSTEACNLSFRAKAFNLPFRAKAFRPYSNTQQGLLLNNPHNPTGKLWTKNEILPYLKEFDLVVIDEAFMDFLPPSQQQSLIPAIADFPNLVILRSLTKFYSLPGLRIGYAIAHPERLDRWQQWRDPWSVNSLAAAATEAVLQDTKFQLRTWNWLPEARSQLIVGLNNIDPLHPLPSAANFLLVKTDISATELQIQLLQKYKILIRDCLSFPELGDRYFRIAVRLPQDNLKLINAIKSVISNQ